MKSGRERAANSVGKIPSGQKRAPDTSMKATPSSSSPSPSRVAPILVVAGLSLLVLLVFWQVGGHSFINYDDGQYIWENPHVQGGLSKESVSWAFTTFYAVNWHPLTWLSHMTDVQLFGLDAGWHHRMNVLFHLANTLLLFLVLWRMTGGLWRSAFVAALFAVHPLHVESVAWVSERKDVLSTLFWLLTMGAYLEYVRRPSVSRYLPVFVFLALGLMCKPMLVTLPFVLLLLDWWPLGRMSAEGAPASERWRLSLPTVYRRVWEKMPLLGLSAISCVVTYIAQSQGKAVVSLGRITIGPRLSNTLVSYAVYLEQMVWPSSLAVIYPHPAIIGGDIAVWKVAGSVLLLAGISWLVWRERQRRPYLALGWLWYLGTLVPVIGLVQVGGAAHADRYTYVPLIGVFIAAAWGVPELIPTGRWRERILGVSAGAVLAALAVTAWFQAGYWRDNITLYSRSLVVTEGNWMVLSNLGGAYEDRGEHVRARECFMEALRIKPEYAPAWYNFGVSTASLGRQEEAIGYYMEALRVEPEYAPALNGLGLARKQLGRLQEAAENFSEAVRIDPEYVDAWYNLGVVDASLGRVQEAIACFRATVRIKPKHASAWYNMGLAQARLGRIREASENFAEAVRIDPGHGNAWYNMGIADAQLGRIQEAIACFRETVRVKPDFAEAWNSLGLIYEKLGRREEAEDCFREAGRLKGR
jgi:tetratricopeptide (TPR) repeat protein